MESHTSQLPRRRAAHATRRPVVNMSLGNTAAVDGAAVAQSQQDGTRLAQRSTAGSDSMRVTFCSSEMTQRRARCCGCWCQKLRLAAQEQDLKGAEVGVVVAAHVAGEEQAAAGGEAGAAC
jgi:hypothetical protein